MENNKFDKTMLDERLISNYKDEIDYDIAMTDDIDIQKNAISNVDCDKVNKENKKRLNQEKPPR